MAQRAIASVFQQLHAPLLRLLLVLLLLVGASVPGANGFLLRSLPSSVRRSTGESVAAVPPVPVAGTRFCSSRSSLLLRHNGADDHDVIARVQAWIKNMVIGLRLCPFAEGVVVADSVHYVVSKGSTPTAVVTDVMAEALRLVATKEEMVATTVVIAPLAFIDDFSSFYETELFLEEHLAEGPLADDVLVACFHPQYEFGGEPKDDPIHYEKRSPFPVFNLLRAQRVYQFADEGKTERIAANNQETLSRTGIAEVRRRFALEAPEEQEGEKE